MLTVLTWFWAQPGGRTRYTAEHVNIWADMVRRNLSQPARIACVTDLTAGLDRSIEIIPPPGEFEDARIPSWGEDRPQCLRRLVMFRRDAAHLFGERFVCMDLDCVVTGPLDPLFDRPEPFVIAKGSANGRPYNGSMMLIAAGARPQVYERFSLEGATQAGRRYLGSDQAWLAHILGPGEATWGEADGLEFWTRTRAMHRFGREPRVVFFPGAQKPWEVAISGRSDLVGQHYRREARGRCLVLSYGPRVWREAEAALAGPAFDAVIASPEAAEHWPGPIEAVASSDAEAMRLARLKGYAEIVVCGASEQEAA